ncbi:19781_t:CDS:2 [Cetraspora pellucida]|uniref:19781_t:CDS:1 n=1 Tax=Cetraspora pellucida TaxID=1433469 RepID=A0A9N9N6X6_9GLOM|nr:19781_t:CDS:2 [Cetraspora pellucida]
MSNSITTSTTNDNNLFETYYVPPTLPNPRPNQRTSNSNHQHNNRRNRYDRREDDDYNIDESRSLDNFLKENSEWCKGNNFNEYENPRQQQERLNQN